MTKSEQFAQAIKATLAAAEPRRALYWRFCREYTAKSAEVGSVEELANQFAASLFAAEATNIEAQAVCACYIAYKEYKKAAIEKAARNGRASKMVLGPYLFKHRKQRILRPVLEVRPA